MAIAYDGIGDEQKASELFSKLKSVTGENKAIATLNFIYSTGETTLYFLRNTLQI